MFYMLLQILKQNIAQVTSGQCSLPINQSLAFSFSQPVPGGLCHVHTCVCMCLMLKLLGWYTLHKHTHTHSATLLNFNQPRENNKLRSKPSRKQHNRISSSIIKREVCQGMLNERADWIILLPHPSSKFVSTQKIY